MVRNIPIGVKIISVLYYIGAAAFLILGIVCLFGAGAIGTLLQSIPLLGALGAGFFIVLGVIFIAIAVLAFFIGLGLWKGQKWAWIAAIVIAILGALSAIISIIQGNILNNIISLIINLVIGGYLLFSKDVKAAFK